MEVSVVTDRAGFRELRPAWNSLLARSRVASVFVSWEWLHPWWESYGAGHELRLLLARKGGELVGLLPVYLHAGHALRVFPVRTLRFLGVGGDTTPDDLDALLDPDHSVEAAAALAGYAVARLGGWDLMRLTDMAGESEFRHALRAELAGHRALWWREGVSARISFANLPRTWEEYVDAHSHKRRHTIRRSRRRIEAQPGARLFLLEDPALLDEAFQRLAHLHNMRWRGRSEQHGFSSPAYLAFHRAAMDLCAERGWLRLYCLELDGDVVAMMYCYRFRDATFHFQSGFDPGLSQLSPGQVLMGYAIERSIEEGAAVFDMLRGEYEYKTQWAPERRETHYLHAHRLSAGALAHLLRREWLPALKRCFVRWLPGAKVQEAPKAGRQESGGA